MQQILYINVYKVFKILVYWNLHLFIILKYVLCNFILIDKMQLVFLKCLMNIELPTKLLSNIANNFILPSQSHTLPYPINYTQSVNELWKSWLQIFNIQAKLPFKIICSSISNWFYLVVSYLTCFWIGQATTFNVLQKKHYILIMEKKIAHQHIHTTFSCHV